MHVLIKAKKSTHRLQSEVNPLLNTSAFGKVFFKYYEKMEHLLHNIFKTIECKNYFWKIFENLNYL